MIYAFIDKHNRFTRASQSQFDNTKAWDLGPFDTNFPPQCDGCPPIRGKDAWNHLQTFAPGASLAPEYPYTSSLSRQHKALSDSSSSLGDVGTSFEYSCESRNSRSASPLQQKVLYETQYARSIPVRSLTGDYQKTRHQSLETPLQHRFGRESMYKEETNGQASTSSSSEYQSMFRNEQPVLQDSGSFFDGERDAPYYPNDDDHDNDYMANDLTYRSNHLGDESLDQDFMGQSWQRSPFELLDVPLETSRRQMQELSPMTNEEFGWAGSSLEPPVYEQWEESRQVAPASCSTQASQNATHDPTSEGFQDYPGAILIPGCSKRYDSTLTSSFPPTAGHFPAHVPNVRKAGHEQATFSDSQPTSDFPKLTSIPMRRKNSRQKYIGRSRSTSLKVIPEQHNSSGNSPTGSLRGRRRGHLDPATALAAGLKRSDGTVCIRCKVMKQTASVAKPPPSLLLLIHD